MSKFKKILSCPVAAVLFPVSAGTPSRTRALDNEEKQAKRQTILDAADRLFAQRHDLANVADIALAAGLAKGTVYLYFQSKEEIYLALHLRLMEHFLVGLIERLNRVEPFGFDEMTAMANEHILSAENYLPLGACCIGFAADAVPAAASAHFQSCVTDWLEQVGAGLERHFPKLPPGEGSRILNHSYAIMIGLYSLMRSGMSGDVKQVRVKGMGSFQDEAVLALTRYWAQVAGIEGARLTHASAAKRTES
jgi:AcrR family transcriptional regulator